MSGDEIMMFAVPLSVFLVSGFSAFAFARHALKGVRAGGAVLWALFTAVMVFGLANASGWDGLGYVIGLIGVSAPSAAGGLLGTLIGWVKGKKDKNEEPSRSTRSVNG